jgi:glucose-6-phosphate dehydrogenase assembly protein OpcA
VTRTLGTWQAEATSVEAVERAVAGLRRQEERAAVRTAVLTLVVLVDRATCAETQAVVLEMAGRHPSHALLLVSGDRDAAPRIDADVRVHLLERGERAVCFEDVVLQVAGPAVDHLDSIVEAFTLPDLPVVVWFPGRLPSLSDPLLASADRVVADSKVTGGAAVFPDLLMLSRRFPVTDLSWVRLAPWRELLGGLFEGAEFRPFLDRVRAVRVAGKAGPRHLLAGWLASCLGLDRSRFHLEESTHATIEVHAGDGGRQARFVVARPHDDPIIEAAARVDGGPSHARTLRLRDRSPARVLGQALGHMGHDPVYESALAAAVDLGP